MNRILNKIGEYDYDFKNDIFFFKVKDREYSQSIELNNLVIDFDEEDFVVGVQIFNASEIFGISKKILLNIKEFQMKAKVDNGQIQVGLSFVSQNRNQQIKHKPIIFQNVGKEVPNSEVISCLG